MKFIRLFLIITIAFSSVACSQKNASESGYVPTDYSKSTSWYQNGKAVNNALADVFYVLPTCVVHSMDSTGNEHFQANLSDKEQIENMNLSYQLADNIFGDSTNFFAPYYQQITLGGYYSKEYESAQTNAMTEVKNAFHYYLEHDNGGRPFILAGFSQGGQGVVELLRDMDEETFQRMVAAYVVGYKVTGQDTTSSPHFKAAQCADDRGVVIVYNTAASPEEALKLTCEGNLFCINPVTWSTDTLPARLNDTVSVTLDPIHHLLIPQGLNPNDYFIEAIKDYITLGSYHLGELTLYQTFLRENVKRRAYKK